MTTLIKNGTVVSATGRHAAEVLVDGTSIAAVMAPGSATAQAAESGADRQPEDRNGSPIILLLFVFFGISFKWRHHNLTMRYIFFHLSLLRYDMLSDLIPKNT